ncbi:MAG: hypothetical protein RL594_146 [Bacteroidota bacterium]|jgi:septal ring-binding cell division protein DamX
MRYFSFVIALTVIASAASAQQANVKQYIQQVASGWTTDAKKALPDLLIDAPDDPAVLFLHASLIEDPKKASPLLERIVDAFPKSEWADDAMARLVIMYAAKNEADKAKKAFSTMRDQYSQSELLPIVYEVMRSTVGAPAPSDKIVATPASKAVEPQLKPVSKGYTLAVMTSSEKNEADRFAAKLRKKGLKVTVAPVSVRGQSKYSVRVGDYESETEALKELVLVRSACDCKPTVIKK